MIQEGFAHGDSVLHRLDPRVKILVALCFSVTVAVGDRLMPAAAGLALAAAMVAVGSMKPSRLLARLAVVNGFILLLWAVLPFTFPGEPLLTLGPLTASREGVNRALLITLKSNAIVLGRPGRTVGVGAGQMSRVDAVRLAVSKSMEPTKGTVLASDAFFPFRDGVDEAVKAGVTAIVQPGGSARDGEVIAAADERGLAMILTGTRHFRH